MDANQASPVIYVFHSWKEISSYTRRGVRTIQRYERNLGFPVHRPLGKPRSSVLAFKHEIDLWMAGTPIAARTGDVPKVDAAPERPPRSAAAPLTTLYQSTDKWRMKTQSVQYGVSSMQQAINAMQENVNTILQGLQRTQSLMLISRTLWEQTQTRRNRRQRIPEKGATEVHAASVSAG